MQFLTQRELRSSWKLLLSHNAPAEAAASGVTAREVRAWMEQAFGWQLKAREQLAERLLEPPNPFDPAKRRPKIGVILLACTLLLLVAVFFYYNY